MLSPHKSGYYGDDLAHRQTYMCLILLAYQHHPDYPFIVAANRDEFYARPTAPAQFWVDQPQLLAGRDLQAGGTWMGITREGRFAAITNVREPEASDSSLRSRGELTTNFLSSDVDPQAYLQSVHQQYENYAGFNLLVGTLDALWFYSNRDHSISALQPGLYGISNGGFDEHWPKVARGKQLLKKALTGFSTAENLLCPLQDQYVANDEQLPHTGVDIETERWLSPLFIQSDHYGTRSSTIITLNNNNDVTFLEQTYKKSASRANHTQYAFNLTL
jgi:uncharacterized protein with NRDE domain